MAPFVELTAAGAGPEGVAEHVEKRGGLRGVPRARSRGVRVDVPHPRGFEPRVHQRRAHRRRGARAVRRGLRHVKRCRRLVRILRISATTGAPLARADASDSSTNTPAPSPITNPPRAASKGRQHPAGSSGSMPMAAGSARALARVEPRDGGCVHAPFRASREHHVRVAALDESERVADGVRARSARGGGGVVGSAETVRHAHLACAAMLARILGTKKGDKRRRRAEETAGVGDIRDVAHARADGDAPARALGVGGVGGGQARWRAPPWTRRL